MTEGCTAALRRKIAAALATQADAGGDGDAGARAWRLALARAARDEIGLVLEVSRLADDRRSLVELLDLPPDRAFLAMLEGPEGGVGLLALSADLLAAIIEVQTVGRLTPAAPPPRRPTRTDAALAAGVIDRALCDLEVALAEAPDLTWAGGFRYASFLEDARPLGLLLEDQGYRVLDATVALGGGDGRGGQAILALPAAGRGPRPAPRPALATDAMAEVRAWQDALQGAVRASPATLDAVIGRIRLPLSVLMALDAGMTLPLGAAGVGAVALEGPDGRAVATGRLGQSQGARALRLTDLAVAGMPGAASQVIPTAPDAIAAADPARPLARSA